MSNREARHIIERLKRKYILYRIVEIALFSAAVAILLTVLCSFLAFNSTYQIAIATSGAVSIFIWLVFFYKLVHLPITRITAYLNSNYPQLEHSLELVLKEGSDLHFLQRIQCEIVMKRFISLVPHIKLPNRIAAATIVAVVSICLFMMMRFIQKPLDYTVKDEINLIKQISEAKSILPELSSLKILIIPPSYTKLPTYTSSAPNVKVQEGSNLIWRIEYSAPVREVKIIVSAKDSIKLLLNDQRYQATIKANESGFYQIQWNNGVRNMRSDYYKIVVIKDQPPKITVDNLSQFTKLPIQSNLKISIESTLADDYGLTDATIIATVSKGSGESVKFREEKFKFDQLVFGKLLKVTKQLDLKKLGMEPGDELYFYVEATDNKTPHSNYSRTETFFIALQDTTKQTMVEDEGLGVDLMPDYFRSQRQIIIDTEKLLKEKKLLNADKFKTNSNNLGYDQKVLRLRYGQFLGEEFEDKIGKQDESQEEDHETLISKFGHIHDKENEHNLVTDKKSSTPPHEHESTKGNEEKQNPLEAFAHNHDNGEQATFFVQSVRAKLKSALTVMWDAELYLRLYQPEKSLPFQYTALKLLKEISNDSRIYVHRTGFDPPPLKEEKRLSADLSEIHNSSLINNSNTQVTFPEIRIAITLIERLLSTKATIKEDDRNQFRRAGQELARVIIEHPGTDVRGLSLVKELEDRNSSHQNSATNLVALQKIFWKIIPEEANSAHGQTKLIHKLDTEFEKRVKALRNE